MRFGVCFGINFPQMIAPAVESGFDYVECGFSLLSKCEDSIFEEYKQELFRHNIKCEAANGFLPGDMRVLDHSVGQEEFISYLKKGFERGLEIGLRKVCFGSSQARNIPDGMAFDEGFRGLVRFLTDTVAPLAEKYQIEVVIEPLCRDESNIINSIAEGVMLAAAVNSPYISTLADLYHMVKEGDSLDLLRQLRGNIHHSHISNPFSKQELKRDYPMHESEFDYQGFISALKYVGCDTCSVEANFHDYCHDVKEAGALLSRLNRLTD